MKQSLAAILTDLLLAFRNVIRQKRRAGFALAIIGGGVIAMLLAGGFIQWVLDTMRESTIYSQLGHIQVVRPDYYQKGIADPYRYLLPQGSEAEKQISSTPSVVTVTPRLSFSGLISFHDASLSFMGDGVDPAGERDFEKYFFIEKGERLEPPKPDDPDAKHIIIGKGLQPRRRGARGARQARRQDR